MQVLHVGVSDKKQGNKSNRTATVMKRMLLTKDKEERRRGEEGARSGIEFKLNPRKAGDPLV